MGAPLQAPQAIGNLVVSAAGHDAGQVIWIRSSDTRAAMLAAGFQPGVLPAPAA